MCRAYNAIEATINKAHQIIDLYESYGIGKDRVLIKVSIGSYFESRLTWADCVNMGGYPGR